MYCYKNHFPSEKVKISQNIFLKGINDTLQFIKLKKNNVNISLCNSVKMRTEEEKGCSLESPLPRGAAPCQVGPG